MKKKYHLLTYFQALSYLAIIGSSLVIYLTYSSLKSEYELKIHQEKKKEALIVSNQVTDIIHYVENFTHLIGSRIVEVGPNNKKEIAKILQEITQKIDNEKNIFTWTFFDFITPDGRVVATSKDGIMQKEIIIGKEKRSWMVEAPKHPWKIHLAKSDIGIVSGENIIPCGFAITDKNNKVIGLVTLGISVKKLKEKTQAAISDPIISFALLNSDNSVVFASENFNEEDLARQITSDKDNYINSYFELNKKQYYRSFLKSYEDMSVIVGVNSKDFRKELLSQLLPKILNTIFLTLLFLILLYFVKKLLLKPVLALARSAKQISAGNLNINLPQSNIHEINILCDSIDMVRNVVVKEEKTKDELRHANDKVKRISEEKIMLVKSFTDELQNMLSRIVGLTQIIKTNFRGKVLLGAQNFDIQDVLVNERHASDIAKISSEINHFIEDLFLITKSEKHIAVFEQEMVDLKALLFNVIKLLRSKAIDHNKIIKTNVPVHSTNSEFVASNVDPVRTKQVLFNIVNKAIRSDFENSDINVEIARLSEEETAKINKIIKQNLVANNEIDSQKKSYLFGLLNQKRTRVAITIFSDQPEIQANTHKEKILKNEYKVNAHKISHRVEIIDLEYSLMKYIIECQGGMLEVTYHRGDDSPTIKIIL